MSVILTALIPHGTKANAKIQITIELRRQENIKSFDLRNQEISCNE